MATKERPRFPKRIDSGLMSSTLERMEPAHRDQAKQMAEQLAGRLNIRQDEALDLLLRLAWAEMGKLETAAGLCSRLNGRA